MRKTPFEAGVSKIHYIIMKHIIYAGEKQCGGEKRKL